MKKKEEKYEKIIDKKIIVASYRLSIDNIENHNTIKIINKIKKKSTEWNIQLVNHRKFKN